MGMEEDPIVKEVNVNLSKKLVEQLYLLQYPVRPACMTYDSVDHVAARIKPKQQKVELEVSLDTSGPSYNDRKGNEIANNVDGKGQSAQSFFSSDRMDKQVLISKPVGCDVSRYAIGAMKNGELHLTPLKAIVQLRPGFSYLDTADVRAEAARASQAAEKAAAAGESSQDEEEVRPVVAKFARHESDEAKARRMASYDYMKHKNDEETWIKLHHHSLTEIHSDNERQLLYSDTSTDSTGLFSMTSEQYLQKLVKNEDGGENTTQTNKVIMSMKRVRRMPLSDQMKTIMLNVNAVRFSELLRLVLTPGVTVRDVLLSVQQVAILIQGCWVVKSSLIYPQNTFSAYNNKVSAEILCRARDYILWKFSCQRKITRKELNEIVSIPKEDEKEMLEQMAIICDSEGWQFKFDYDEEFLAQHPDVVNRQKQLWEAKVRFLSSVLPIDVDLIEPNTAHATKSSHSHGKSTGRRRSSSGGRRKSSLSAEAAVPAAAIDESADSSSVHNIEENTSMDLISTSLLEDLVSDTAEMPDIQDLDNILGECDSAINDLEFETSNHESLGPCSMNGVEPQSNTRMESNAFEEQSINPQLKSHVFDFVNETLKNRVVLTTKELKAQFSIKLNELPPGHLLGSGVSDFLLEHCLKEVGVKVSGSKGELFFVRRHHGDEFDFIRDGIVDLLTNRHIIRITQLRKKLEGVTVSDEDLKKVLKEYCFTSGGSWHLKGTKD